MTADAAKVEGIEVKIREPGANSLCASVVVVVVVVVDWRSMPQRS